MYQNALWQGGSVVASSRNPYFPEANISNYIAASVWRSGTALGTETLTITLDRNYNAETIYLVLHGFDFSQCSSVSYQLGALPAMPLIGWTNGQAFVTVIEVPAANYNTLVLSFVKNAPGDYVQVGKIFIGDGFDNSPIDEPESGGLEHQFFEMDNKDVSIGGQKFAEGLYQSWKETVSIPYVTELVMADTIRPWLKAVGTWKPFFVVVDNTDLPLSSAMLSQVYFASLAAVVSEKYKVFGASGYLWSLDLSFEEQL